MNTNGTFEPKIFLAEESESLVILAMLTPYLLEIRSSAEYPYLDSYWRESDRFPYLLKSEDAVIGSVLVRTLVDQVTRKISEFYIRPELRKKGFGHIAFRQVLKTFDGSWSLSVKQTNEKAYAFWNAQFKGKSIVPRCETDADSITYFFKTGGEKPPQK